MDAKVRHVRCDDGLEGKKAHVLLECAGVFKKYVMASCCLFFTETHSVPIDEPAFDRP